MSRATTIACLWFILQSAACDVVDQERAAQDDAWTRGLVDVAVNASTMIKEADRYHARTNSKQFKGHSLGFVTPWNGRGYEMAKLLKHKLTHIAPVWYQLVPDGRDGVRVQGQHDVDVDWMAALRSCSSVDQEACDAGALIVPRFNLELDAASLRAAVLDPSQLIDAMIQECQRHAYDGIVLEAWPILRQYVYSGNAAAAEAAYRLIDSLADALHKHTGAAGLPMLLILAVPPAVAPNGQSNFQAAEFRRLQTSADFFAWMTYDFGPSASSPNAAANAPIPWLEQNLQALLPQGASTPGAHKLLLGLNFYGWEYCGSAPKAKLAHDVLDILRKKQPSSLLTWDSTAQEHHIRYKRNGVKCMLWYPTPASLDRRLALAQQFEIGVSVWELGQGLSSCIDLM